MESLQQVSWVSLTTSELRAPPAFLEEKRTCLSPDFQKTFHSLRSPFRSHFLWSGPDLGPALLPRSDAPRLLHLLHPPSLCLCWVLPIGARLPSLLHRSQVPLTAPASSLSSPPHQTFLTSCPFSWTLLSAPAVPGLQSLDSAGQEERRQWGSQSESSFLPARRPLDSGGAAGVVVTLCVGAVAPGASRGITPPVLARSVCALSGRGMV